MMPARAIVRLVAERLHPGVGCADASCIFGHAGGMATNGGCQCMRERSDVALRRIAMQLRDVAITLAAPVAELDRR